MMIIIKMNKNLYLKKIKKINYWVKKSGSRKAFTTEELIKEYKKTL